jgi:hypothetical protein
MAAPSSTTSEGLASRVWHSRPWAVGKGPAYELWHQWPPVAGARGLVHAAVLAANAHDTQPWCFRIVDHTIAVFPDFKRNLGSFDPFRREMHLSIGCALENLVHAAKAQGLDAQIEMPPATLSLAPPLAPDEPVAIVRMVPGDRAETKPFHAIPRRHTHRGAFLPDREVPTSLLAEIDALAQQEKSVRLILLVGGRKAPLAELIVSATREIVDDRQMAADNARWFRFHASDVEAYRDGLTLDTNVVPPLQNLAAKIFPPSAASAAQHWIHDTEHVHVATAPLLGIIAVRDLYDRATALRAGRFWQRLHLWLTMRGLAAQPLNQPVEWVDRERALDRPVRTVLALSRIVGFGDWHPTFVFRAGYAKQPSRLSPRRAIEAVVAA